MNEYTFSKLDIDKNQKAYHSKEITLRQGDKNGCEITATLYDHGQRITRTDLTAYFVMELPFGDYYYRKQATYNAGVMHVTIDESTAASVPGDTDIAYFELRKDTELIATTEAIRVHIEPSALADKEPGKNYDSAIQNAINALTEATDSIPEQVQAEVDAQLVAHPEWTTTVQDGAISRAKLASDLTNPLDRLMYRLSNLLTATTAEAEAVTVADAAQTPMAGLTLYGKSTQDGTPTPDAPVTIESVESVNLLDLSSMKGATSRCVVTENPDGSLTLTSTEAGEIWVGFTMTTSGTWNDANGSPVPVVGGERIYLMEFGTARRVFITWLDASKRFISFADQVMEGTPLRAIIVPSNASYAGFRIGAAGVQASGVDHTVRFVVSRKPCAGFVPYHSTAVLALGKNMLDATLLDGGRNKCTTVHNPDGSLTLTSTEAGEIWVGGVTTVSDALWYPGFGQLVPVFGGGSVYIGQYGTAKRTFLCFYDGAYRSITYQEATPSAQVARVSVPSNARFMTIRVGVVSTDNTAAGSSFTVKTVVSASAPDGWTPHTESVTAIPLDSHTLRSLPDGTRDEVTVDQHGHVTLIQRVGSATFDGSSDEAWEYQGAADSSLPNRHRIALAGLVDGARVATNVAVKYLRCDRFKTVCDSYNNAGTYWGEIGVSARRTAAQQVLFQHGGESTADWRTWLASNPVTIDYALATPVTHDLGTIDPTALVGPDLTAQTVPTAPFALTYERDLNTTLARLEAAIAALA